MPDGQVVKKVNFDSCRLATYWYPLAIAFLSVQECLQNYLVCDVTKLRHVLTLNTYSCSSKVVILEVVDGCLIINVFSLQVIGGIMVYLVVEFIQEEKAKSSSMFNEQDCIAKWPNIRSQVDFRSLLISIALP